MVALSQPVEKPLEAVHVVLSPQALVASADAVLRWDQSFSAETWWFCKVGGSDYCGMRKFVPTEYMPLEHG